MGMISARMETSDERRRAAGTVAATRRADPGPNLGASTTDNLKCRVDCWCVATRGKSAPARCATQNSSDAFHDPVHEMARDEARHGRALKGLLERYFK